MVGDQPPVEKKHRRRRFRSRVRRHITFNAAPAGDHSNKRQTRDFQTRSSPPSLPQPTLGQATKRRRFNSFRRSNNPKPNDVRLFIDPPPAKLELHGNDEKPSFSGNDQQSNDNPTSSSATKDKNRTSQSATTSDNKRTDKKRPRRAPKRKWKPYSKLTCEERRELEEREERRAERVRELRFKSGLPVAPYNTTQFLFDDLQRRGGSGQLGDDQQLCRLDVDTIVESIRHRHQKRSRESAAGGAESISAKNKKVRFAGNDSTLNEAVAVASSDSDSISDYGELANAKQFEHDYDAAFIERLSTMTRDRLITEYLQLEKQYEKTRREADTAQAQLAQLRRSTSSPVQQASNT